jgi:hypothetical protein
MAIAYAAIGSTAVGTTSLSVPLPASISAGNILLLCVVTQSGTPVAPSGWKLLINSDVAGSGTNAADVGTRKVVVWLRIADGSESGNQSVTSTVNTAVGVILRYTKASDKDIQAIINYGADTTADTSWSITGLHSIFKSGDVIITASAINTDNYTFSGQAITVTGPTLGTEVERHDAGTNNGNDCALVISEHPITTADHSVGFSYAMTSSGTATNNPAGITTLIQLREVEPEEEIEGLQALTLITEQGEPDKPIVGFNGITFLFEGGLNIKVEDSRGRDLSGVLVEIENPDTVSPVMAFTDSNGNVVLDVDTSNPNPITVTLGKLSKTVNYTTGNSLTIVFDNSKPPE